MKAITLRNIPPEVQRAIRAKARQKRISVNRAVIEMLQERIGMLEERKKNVYEDLDGLAGSWSAREAKQFEDTLSILRRIDDEMWR